MPSTEEGDEQKIKENPFYPIATATLKTRVFDVVHMFSERGISAVPIIDENGVVVNLYETVDVIVCLSFDQKDATLSIHFHRLSYDLVPISLLISPLRKP